MSVFVALLFLLTAVSGTGVVLTRTPRRQVFAIAINGLVMTLLFMALQAPDVAFSELTVGTAALPALFLITLTSIRQDRAPQAGIQQAGSEGTDASPTGGTRPEPQA